ncbi:deaminase [Parapedobacter pyrenivorans]|uniref:Deaminase n=1 Tax=Parapedobacter pyrenivorans TaxID=1305674 RepID=A0A917HKE3_9SPHI|nr:dihydrofolate reductase family protein [Parapedobacter pyrenivorans]GGG81912.1 deaminase [Parapedobacter pyrenivorans]
MKRIVYYVASSIDGYISGINDDVSGFLYDGKGVERYLEDLKAFRTVIMGRSTYEFGYKFGVEAGQPSPTYAHMMHYIFSDNLRFESQSEQVVVKRMDIDEVKQLKETSETDIYLCGGGKLAGWLLENKQLDVLKIKLNPLVIGKGVKLFEGLGGSYQLELIESNTYENGLQLISYSINY